MSVRKNGLKTLLLTSASAIAIAATMGGAAQAASDTVTLVAPSPTGFFSDTATGYVTAGTAQINTADVAASIATTTSNLVANTVTTGPVSGSHTVTVNTFSATATGNTQTNTVALGAIGSTPVDGIGVLATQINASPSQGTGGVSAVPPTITSSVTGSSMSATLNDFTTGSATVTGNTISATTTGNSTTSAVSGQVPNGYSSTTLGSNAFDGSSPTPSTVNGTVAVSTVQDNLNVGQNFGSYATVGGTSPSNNSIALSIQPTAAGSSETVTSGAQVSNNALSANYVGNASNNGIAVQTGTNPTFTGSLALSNASANYVDGTVTATAGVAASNTNSTVSATIQDASASTFSDTLAGGLTVSGNTISSSASGNQSLGTGTSAGNQISVADGENFAAPAPAGSGNTNNITSSTGVSAATNADLLLFNSQSNAGKSANYLAGVTAQTQGGSVGATVDNVSGGSVTLGSNAITATASGSSATNAILASGATLGTTASITGTAALGSAQVNEYAPVTANLGTNSVTATVGAIATGSNVTTATVSDASVSLAGNSLAASGFGNSVGNTLDLAATTLTPSGTAAATSLSVNRTDPTGETVTDATAGASINNVQRLSDGSTVTASNTGSLTGIDASGVTSAIGNSSLSVTGGSVAGIAVGNSGSNALSLAATNLTNETGGIVNAQTVGDNTYAANTITASVTDPQLLITAGNATYGVSDSSLGITGNLLRSFAVGNQGTNSLSATGDTVTVPSAGTPSSLIAYNIAAAGGLIYDETNPATVKGAYDILSSQATSSPVSAQFTGTQAPVLISVGNGVTGSTANADNNTIYATAIGNEIAPSTGNTLSLSANSLATANTALAGVTNIQELGTGGSALANINTVGGGPLHEVNVGGDVTSSTATVSNNWSQALAEGNLSNNNTLNVTGNAISDTGTFAGLSITGALPPAGTGNVTANLALTVVNTQSVAAGDAVNATVQATGAGGSTGGYGALINVGGTIVTNSTLAQANNVFLATAIDNNAQLNTISVTGLTTLAVSAGVQNLQFSAADASATLGQPGTVGTVGNNFTGNITITPNNANIDNTGPSQFSFPNGDSITFTFGGTGLDGTQQSTFSGKFATDGTVLFSNCSGGSCTTATLSNTTGNPQALTFSGDFTSGSVTYNSNPPYNMLTSNVTGFNLPSTSTTPGTFAQVIAVNDPIRNSKLSITAAPGTIPSGATAISNNAVNTLSLSANIITGSSGIASPNATMNGGTNTLTAAADYAVQNAQAVVAAGPTATAYETLGLTDFTSGTPTPYGITGSSLTISGNALQAVSEGNVGNSTLSLAMTDSGATAPSGALLSTQYTDLTAVQGAVSGLMAYAPAAIGGTTAGTGSSVSISGNSNSALSVLNDATNTASVTGTDVAGLLHASAAYTGGGGTVIAANGNYALNNTQDAVGLGVSATATTSIFNYENLLTTSSGISNSSANFDSNTTSAEADVNRANVGGGNSLSLGATNLTASGALTSSQDSTVGATAGAVSGVELTLTGGTGTTPAPAASGSNISVSGNDTASTARGNIAINTLTADGSATNGTASGTAVANATQTYATNNVNAGSTTSTNMALANVQSNSGTMSATGSATESVTLTGGPSGTLSQGAVSSNLALDNNIVTAEADGSVASSTLSLTGTNLYNNGALASSQSNSGTIGATAGNTVSASVTGTSTGTGTPGTAASTVDVSGNQSVATARGNSATNALNALPSANYGTQGSGATSGVGSTAASATASYAVLNWQSNSGGVTATASGSYTVALNSAAGSSAAVTGSSVGVSGNQVAANAYGNSASNGLTMSALNTGNATAALTNAQTNSGPINAVVNGATNSINAGTTGAGSSSFSVASNSVSAHAVGNSAVNSIGVR